MKVVTVLFDREETDDYSRMYNAFDMSMAESMPNVEIQRLKVKSLPEQNRLQRDAWANNLAKMRVWKDVRIREHTLFLDCDLIVQHSLEPLTKLGADIVLTTGGASPFNAGVIAVAPGMDSFIFEWADITEKMYSDYTLRDEYIGTYRGISQSALGWMLDKYRDKYQVAAVPARYWNAREGDWQHVTDETRVVHYKSELRRMVLGCQEVSPEYKKAIEIWERYDRS